MDLSKLISQATSSAPVAAEPKILITREDLNIPAQDCQCGHPANAHVDGSDDCEILECECTSYYPESQVPVIDDLTSQVVETKPDVSLVAASGNGAPPEAGAEPTSQVAGAPFVIPAAAVPAPEETGVVMPLADTELDATMCHHLCESCNQWFSHGDRAKCRHYDVLVYGKCAACLVPSTDAPFDPLADWKDGQLTPLGQVKVRQKERVVCADMSIEQLTYHMEFLQKQIQEFMAKGLEARKMRSDLEEEEIANIPEHEREAFRQALRQGSKATTRKPRAKKAKSIEEEAASGARVSKLEKTILSLMKSMGKTRAEVEAFLND